MKVVGNPEWLRHRDNRLRHLDVGARGVGSVSSLD
jgi:hypothetical protein